MNKETQKQLWAKINEPKIVGLIKTGFDKNGNPTYMPLVDRVPKIRRK